MFVFKKLFVSTLIILISGCTIKNFGNTQNVNRYSIEIETPNDKYNLYFKENLKRYFQISNNKKEYILSTKITFETTKTLSVGGQNNLKSTKAKIDYKLMNKNTSVVKTGSINTFPALSSSSNSFYTQEKSVNHIKERLTKSSAKSLYKRIKIIIRSLT
tara:strand:- start:1453 stop:1929 length:477 start_codon:yes stop_codon:yes gene_type:complete